MSQRIMKVATHDTTSAPCRGEVATATVQASRSCSASRTPGRSARPASVSSMRRLRRRNSATPSAVSSVLICRLTAPCVRCSSPAASEKLRRSAAISKAGSVLSGGSRRRMRLVPSYDEFSYYIDETSFVFLFFKLSSGAAFPAVRFSQPTEGAALSLVAVVAIFLLARLAPPLEGLSAQGQGVLGAMVAGAVLWIT